MVLSGPTLEELATLGGYRVHDLTNEKVIYDSASALVDNLVYAFVVRHNEQWEEFVIVRRKVLDQLRTEYGALSGESENQTLSLTFTSDKVM